MGTIWIRELKAGLDTRRLAETSPGGVLIEAIDGHISRGGEYEQRAAFVPAYTLPAGTTGLMGTRAGLIVFGSGPAPTLPIGIIYQRLQHPSGLQLTRVLSEDLYAGKAYVAAQFSDGSVYHFYDGVRVEDWFDGRARAAFRVAGGQANSATAASGRFDIVSGTSSPGVNRITSVQVDGVTVTAGPVNHTGSNTSTAAAVAASINSATSTPDYTATSDGMTVIITAATPGTAANGRVITPFPAGDVTTANGTAFSGGTAASASTSRLDTLKVNGTPVILAPVNWTTSNEATAAAIANAVNTFASSPEYTATSVGETVNLIAADAGAAPNGYSVAFTTSNGLVLSPATGVVLAGGVDSADGFTPGSFVRTVGSKVYSTSGPNLHFSGIQAPTKWKTDTVGAGFIDMSSETSGAEELVAIARYQNYIAVFSEDVIIILYVDPDPELNKQAQVLGNTGTVSGRSVTQFGDADIFYLNESGLRSLRARDSSNAAATEDIGVPVDTLITQAIRSLDDTERAQIIGAIEPRDGRFWLAIKDQIFVFSYFPGSETSAWSVYRPSWNGVRFSVENMVTQDRRVFVRSGNTIYAYGGTGADLQYDDTPAVARLPYLSADVPTKAKNWTGIDGAVRGEWQVFAHQDPTNPDVSDLIGRFFETTFDAGKIGALGNSTHISLRLVSAGMGPHKIGSLVVHYEGKLDDD